MQVAVRAGFVQPGGQDWGYLAPGSRQVGQKLQIGALRPVASVYGHCMPREGLCDLQVAVPAGLRQAGGSGLGLSRACIATGASYRRFRAPGAKAEL